MNISGPGKSWCRQRGPAGLVPGPGVRLEHGVSGEPPLCPPSTAAPQAPAADDSSPQD